MRRIIIIGPESSGKTTLCKQLSEHFKTFFIREYARYYINNLDRDYNKKDLLEIAKGQLKLEKNNKNEKLIFCDTDIITIKIWSEYKYGNCHPFILKQIEKQKSEGRIYLLCKPDIRWEVDSQRENPNNREELFEIYKSELKKLEVDYFVVYGKYRMKNSISKISRLVTNIY